MRNTMIISGKSLDEAMALASAFEIVANVHVTGFTHVTQYDGARCIEIHFEENETITGADEYRELEYVDTDEWPEEYIDYPDWDEDE